MADFGGIPPATGKADLGQPGWYGLASFLNNFGQTFAKFKELEMDRAFKAQQQKKQQEQEQANIEIARMTPDYSLVSKGGLLSPAEKLSYGGNLMNAGMERQFGAKEEVILPSEPTSPTDVPAGTAVSTAAGQPSKWRKNPKVFAPKNPMDFVKYYQDEENSIINNILTPKEVQDFSVKIGGLTNAEIEEQTKSSSPLIKGIKSLWIDDGEGNIKIDTRKYAKIKQFADTRMQKQKYMGIANKQVVQHSQEWNELIAKLRGVGRTQAEAEKIAEDEGIE